MSNQQASRVFVTQEARAGSIDYTPAKAYGNISFLTVMDFAPEEDSIYNVVLIEEIRAKLHDFNAETDYMVITGSPVVTAAVFMILRERQTRVRVLRWSNRDFSYSVVTINLQ